MTTIQITLPDQLAQDAERAGLLSADSLEQLLREQLRSQNADELLAAMERISGSRVVASMSPEEVAHEVRAARAARRTSCG